LLNHVCVIALTYVIDSEKIKTGTSKYVNLLNLNLKVLVHVFD